MPGHSGIWIVVPAYNELSRIDRVLKGLLKAGYQNVVVIDDGSTDETSRVASQFDVWVLRHIINRGQGAAINTGIKFALDHGADVIVTFDSDGQHDVNEIGEMLAPIQSGKCDVVLGSRFLRRKNQIPKARGLMLRMAVWLTQMMTKLPLTDTHNGFRAISKLALTKMKLSEDRMAHASEILHQIADHKLRFTEVPVTIRYSDETLKKGQSNLDAFKILFRLILMRFLL